jgi:hypothetical protein
VLSSLLFTNHHPSLRFYSFMARVIVVGGGLAGLSAAHTLLERGANVILLDKQPYVVSFVSPDNTFSPFSTSRFMGGNSTKATSGINGAGTQSQQDLGIQDSSRIFFEDTKKSVRASRSRVVTLSLNPFSGSRPRPRRSDHCFDWPLRGCCQLAARQVRARPIQGRTTRWS